MATTTEAATATTRGRPFWRSPLVRRVLRLLQRVRVVLLALVRPVTVGVKVAVRGEGRYLLVRHTYDPAWALPGGGVHRRETARAAAAREIAEELAVDPGPLRLFGVYLNRREGRSDHITLYVATLPRLCPLRPNWEVAEAGWFAPTALPEGTGGPTRARIAALERGEPDGEDW